MSRPRRNSRFLSSASSLFPIPAAPGVIAAALGLRAPPARYRRSSSMSKATARSVRHGALQAAAMQPATPLGFGLRVSGRPIFPTPKSWSPSSKPTMLGASHRAAAGVMGRRSTGRPTMSAATCTKAMFPSKRRPSSMVWSLIRSLVRSIEPPHSDAGLALRLWR
jgi:hypothetical protein